MTTLASPEPAADSLAGRAARSILWAGSSQYVFFGLGLVKAILLARLVDLEYFGLVAGARAWVGYLGLLRLDLRPAVLRSREEPEVLDTQFLLESASTLSGFLLFALVVLAWPAAMTAPVKLLCLVLLLLAQLEAVTSTPLYLAERRLRQDLVGRLTMIAAIVGLVVPVVVALSGAMLAALVLDAVLVSAVTRVGTALAVGWRPGWRWHRPTLMDQLRLGWTLWSTGAVARLGFRLDHWLVFNLGRPHAAPWRATGVEAEALYSRAVNVGRFPMDVATGMIGSTALSIYAEGAKQGPAVLAGAYRRLTWTLAWGVFASGTYLLLAAEEVLLVFGGKWQPVAPLLRLLALFVLGRALFQNDAQMLLVLGRERDLQRTTVLQVAAFAALCPPAVLWFGAAGAAAVLSLVTLLGLVLVETLVGRHLGAPTWAAYLRPAAAAAGTFGLVLALVAGRGLPADPWLSGAVKAALCALVFGTVLLALDRASAWHILASARRGLLRR
jgi:O-antigen/teichoic acid export membrane protein